MAPAWTTSDKEPAEGIGPPASHRWDSGSIPGQSIWESWWTKWHWHRFIVQYIFSPVTESLHPCSTFTSSHYTYHKDKSAKLGTLTQGNAASISDSNTQKVTWTRFQSAAVAFAAYGISLPILLQVTAAEKTESELLLCCRVNHQQMHFYWFKKHIKIYVKIRINIAATCFGLRPSSGRLHWTWLKLYLC